MLTKQINVKAQKIFNGKEFRVYDICTEFADNLQLQPFDDSVADIKMGVPVRMSM